MNKVKAFVARWLPIAVRVYGWFADAGNRSKVYKGVKIGCAALVVAGLVTSGNTDKVLGVVAGLLGLSGAHLADVNTDKS